MRRHPAMSARRSTRPRPPPAANRHRRQHRRRQSRAQSVCAARSFASRRPAASYAGLKTQFYQRLQDIYGNPTSSVRSKRCTTRSPTHCRRWRPIRRTISARRRVECGAGPDPAVEWSDAISRALRTDADLGIADAVHTVNQAMQSIAQINGQLRASGMNDGATAQLLDQRDGYIDQLAQLMDIRVIATAATRSSCSRIPEFSWSAPRPRSSRSTRRAR